MLQWIKLATNRKKYGTQGIKLNQTDQNNSYPSAISKIMYYFSMNQAKIKMKQLLVTTW